LNGREPLEDTSTYEGGIIGMGLEELGRLWTGLIWLRAGNNGRLL
jgi:hypothetical protein